MDLKEYEQTKFAMAEIIRSAQAIDSRDTSLQSESRALLMRLADDRFNLMIVGRFSRGKSTLINAVLGGDYLPTGVVPLTSVITTIRYGSRKQAVLNFNGSRLRREVPLSQLAEYVTQQSNPGNVKQVSYVEIELPVELLRRGVFFVDSPGLGSSIAENTQTTERFFPEADAFVLMTSYDSPFSEEEDRALSRIYQSGKTLFVLVNKQDTVSEAERKQVLDFVRERLSRFSFSAAPRVFSISARQGLEGRLSQTDESIAASGVPQFEEELLRFLLEERAQAFVANMHERIEAFLELRRKLERQTERQAIYVELLDRVGSLRTSNREHLPKEEHSYEEEDRSLTFSVELEKQCGCWVCKDVLDAIFGFLSKYQYDLTINPADQQEHAKRGGFCSLHTWQYENISSPYGVCTAYPDLGHRMASELQQAAKAADRSGWSADRIDRLLPSPRTCPVCQVRMETERNAVNEIAASVRRLASSPKGKLPACCLPHLALTVTALGEGRPAELLLNAHAQLLEPASEDAQRYALRHDALRRHLTSEEERRVSQLLLLMLAGHRSICAPWQVETIF
ncbi:MAG: dynamin family protein [Terriglobia bacterium]